MVNRDRLLGTAGAAGLAFLTLSAPALAGDFTYSFNIGAQSDYVFRGISQTLEDPAIQGGIDIGYKLFYAGVWASKISFPGGGTAEVDLYGGIRPTWGPATFDFGVIYYAYPSQGGPLDVDYVELKSGVSVTPPMLKSLTLSGTAYWSPEQTFETGETWTFEGVAAYTLPQVWLFTPTISGLIGYQEGEDAVYKSFNGFDNYTYWNAGVSLAVEKFTFDLRYWDTDITVPAVEGLADERFVFSAKVTLP